MPKDCGSNISPCIKEEEEEMEEKESEKMSKNSTRYFQNNHSKEQTIGDKNESVQTKRRLAKASEKKNIFLLSQVEPRIFSDASKDEG